MEDLGFNYVSPFNPTYMSYGTFAGDSGSPTRMTSILDHVYALGVGCEGTKVNVIPYVATLSRSLSPVTVDYPLATPKENMLYTCRRNYGCLTSRDFILAFNNMSEVFLSKDVNHIHEIIIREITAVLDRVVPIREAMIKKRSTPLNLKADTIDFLRKRDIAAVGSDHTLYQKYRNSAVCRLL